MLEGDVYVAEIIDLRPAAGIIGRLFDAVQRFSANSRFCVGALEFTFDLLHRAVQWSIFGAGRNLVTYATPSHICGDSLGSKFNTQKLFYCDSIHFKSNDISYMDFPKC